MGRVVRFVVVALALAIGGVPLVASGAGAQVESTTTIVVRKVVSGTGTGPSAIVVTCGTNAPVTFNFDVAGHPTTVSGAGGGVTTSIVAGAWQMVGASGSGGTCHFSETVTGGATSTSWTCAYSSTAQVGPASQAVTPPGCSAASGSGTGPIDVVYANGAAVATQTSDVTLTNTFVAPSTTTTTTPPAGPTVAPAVVSTPTFTG